MATSTVALCVLFVSGAAQAITDSVFRYSTPKTGYLSIPATSFISVAFAARVFNIASIRFDVPIPAGWNKSTRYQTGVDLHQFMDGDAR